MSAAPDAILARRASRVILALTAVVSLGAAVAAAPAAPQPEAVTRALAEKARLDLADASPSVRPLARGPAIRVGRAYDAEDEDCTLAVTQTPDAHGRITETRRLSCAQ